MLWIGATGSSTTYELPAIPPETQAELDRWFDNGKFDELVNPCDNVDGMPAPPEPPRRLGALYWPVVGATRFAHGVFPIDRTTLLLLREELGGGNAVTLYYADAPDCSDVPRAFPLFLIAARPISENDCEDSDDLYVVTLVDQRYYWGQQRGSGTTGEPGSWPTLFTALFARVGVASFGGDPVDAAYVSNGRTPTERWSSNTAQQMPTAFLIDYAAACVGSRVVVTPEGVAVQRPTEANLAVATAFHEAAVLDLRHGGGGSVAIEESLAGLPGGVRARWESGGSATTALPTGVSGQYVEMWHDVAGRVGDADRLPQLAQWAQDWYDWQYAPLDALYVGFTGIPASGFIGSVELYHDSLLGYTRVQRPWQGDTSPPAWFPDGFSAALSGAYGTGPNGVGWPWTNDGRQPGPASGEYAYGINGVTTDLIVGEHVWMEPDGFGGLWWFVEPYSQGCGILIDGERTISIDLESIAGDGLIVEPGETPDDCPTLSVDRAGLLEPDCTINYDPDSGAVGVNFTDIVDAGTGLIWDDGTCSLSVGTGCGLGTEINEDGDWVIAVDPVPLAGPREITALIPDPEDNNDCAIGVDLEDDSYTYETLVNNVELVLDAGELCLLVTKTTYTNVFNLAGLHIDRRAGSPTVEQTCIDTCLFATCCGTTPIVATASASPTTVGTGTTINFTGSATGGTPPYTWSWDFGDGATSSSQNPTHSYSTNGDYTVTLTVTDECGNIDTDTITIHVTSGGTSDCCEASYVNLYAYLRSGGSTIAQFTITWSTTANRWEGSTVLPCGDTLYLRYTPGLGCSAGVSYSCNGTNFIQPTADPGCGSSCDPLCVPQFNIVLPGTGAGCSLCSATYDLSISSNDATCECASPPPPP